MEKSTRQGGSKGGRKKQGKRLKGKLKRDHTRQGIGIGRDKNGAEGVRS